MRQRVWLIIGASSGLGHSIAQAALAAGDTVAVAARRAGPLQDLARTYPDRVLALEVDVTDTARPSEIVAGVLDTYGRVDVLVNSAGRALVGAAEETSDLELRTLMDVHFFGPAALTRAVLPAMRERGSGTIVQISSMGGRLAFPGVSAYSATKFALEGFSEGLAAEVAPFGIRVLIVEPGAFRTELHGSAMRMSVPLPAYEDIVGPSRAAMEGFDRAQPGDPAKASAAILATVDAEQPPLRLVLGNDAADAISAQLDQARSEFLAWENVSRGTDFGTRSRAGRPQAWAGRFRGGDDSQKSATGRSSRE